MNAPIVEINRPARISNQPMKNLKRNQLPHIDNNFYVISAAMAKRLSGGTLPRPGYYKVADPVQLQELELGKLEHQPTALKPDNRVFRSFRRRPIEGNVQTTGLTWLNGAAVKPGWVWALHVTKDVSI